MRLVVQPGHGHLGAEQKVSAYGLFKGHIPSWLVVEKKHLEKYESICIDYPILYIILWKMNHQPAKKLVNENGRSSASIWAVGS
jgi:hypothetical protein